MHPRQHSACRPMAVFAAAITIETVNEALKNYRFHEAAQSVYQFFWGDFCDWYIEWVSRNCRAGP